MTKAGPSGLLLAVASVGLASVVVGFDALLISAINADKLAGADSIGRLVDDGSVLGACCTVCIEWVVVASFTRTRIPAGVRQAFSVLLVLTVVCFGIARLDSLLSDDDIVSAVFVSRTSTLFTIAVTVLTSMGCWFEGD